METSQKDKRRKAKDKRRKAAEAVKVKIRWMIRRDMPEVLRIEEASFDFPWCEEDWLRCLRQRNCIGMVAEGSFFLYQRKEDIPREKIAEEAFSLSKKPDRFCVSAEENWLDAEKMLFKEIRCRIAGFLIYELHKTKLYILNFAVYPSHRRCGIGRQMAEKLIAKLSSHRRTRLTIDVRETNLGAQFFFRACGLRVVGVSRGFYEDSGEDAYTMEYRLESEAREAGFKPTNRVSQFFVH